MNRLIALIAVFQLGAVWAQGRSPDLLERFLVRPDLIMRHQRALQLTNEQMDYMLGEIQRTQSEFTSLHWELQGTVEKLGSLMRDPDTNDDELLAQLDQVLDLERKIKRAQLILAVRVKRKLTEEQVRRLQRLKRRQAARRNMNRRRPQPPNRDSQQP